MAKSKQSYQALSTELDEVLLALQNPDVQVDEAVRLYERGLKLVNELQIRITETENKITALKPQTTGE
ncbi:MAG TPA: exodeoxyribonuclease VII small subunit [Candidatus Saccharimonadales bacterium]|nr:exodeoxyribonuclease VII small subunit [Candidatus Saccharimonadales bacterium]